MAVALLCGDFARRGSGSAQGGTGLGIHSSGLKGDSVFMRNWWSGWQRLDFLDFLNLGVVDDDAVSILEDSFKLCFNKHCADVDGGGYQSSSSANAEGRNR